MNQDICNQVTEWASKNLGSKFEFREHQLETITGIIENVIEKHNSTQIIEAPTGSGKSILNIISACVLGDYYGQASYILVSDLFLWKQYEDFVNKNTMLRSKIGMLKGQTGNYTCMRNNQDMRNADCRMGGISWANMFNSSSAISLGYECAINCPYVKARKKALSCNVVIMTYALYHYMINIVSRTIQDSKFSFKKRDIVFCDECHNIPAIMQLNFQPTVHVQDIQKLKLLYSYKLNESQQLFNDIKIEDEELIWKKMPVDELESEFTRIYSIMEDDTASTTSQLQSITDLGKLYDKFIYTIESIEADLAYKKQELHENFTEEDKEYYKAASWYRGQKCEWNDFLSAIDHVGFEMCVRQITENRNTGEKSIIFRIVKEDFICWNYLLSTAKYKIMMSATIGGYDAFSENVGINYLMSDSKNWRENEEVQFSIIPSTFDFSKSPVFFLNRYSMAYKNKQESFPKIQQVVYSICKKFDGKKGIIQTGSYENAKLLYDNAPVEIRKRMLLYNGSREKTSTITLHQMSRDTILVGPTMVEGIDLPGDHCRFICIIKVPYPVITDLYTKKKMTLFPRWYNSVTANQLIQGIGRGNRYKDDYCITYVLDSCFFSLYNATKEEQWPIELQERIKITN